MRMSFRVVAIGLVAAALGAAAHAQGVHGGMDHGTMGHGAMDHGASAAGRPGDPAKASRTLKVTALDTMRFEPGKLVVGSGETVRIEVTNAGKVPHELTIGERKVQLEHERMMQTMPGMKHDDPGSVTLAPGETKTLVWQFGEPGTVEFGCHVPGHYPAGMTSMVEVTAANGAAAAAMHGDHSQHGK